LAFKRQRNGCHLSGPVSREMSLTFAAHSGKFPRTDFTRTSFAGAGPEHERSECEGDLTLLRSHPATGPFAP
jgi:hypothetical protein